MQLFPICISGVAERLSVESAVLQARKALEAVAFAAIAPNKAEYENLRAQAAEPADYRKDYNARKILQLLGGINQDFYPTPVLPPIQQKPGRWHFDRRTEGFLTKKQFESFYDRLGKSSTLTIHGATTRAQRISRPIFLV